MKITKLGSATVVVETKDTKILCDPWLTDGIYYGSWCNYPPIDLSAVDLSDIDYVYISHIHPDHFDPNTMRLISKETPVLIHKYHQKFLKFNIERLGFRVIELDNSVSYELKGKTKISIYAADNCDPRICGHMFGCISKEIKGSMQLDSLCVISDDKHVLVNTNDCPYPIAEKTLEILKIDYPDIDIALVGYTSASLYPHCMMDFSKQEMQNGILKAQNVGLLTAINTIKALRPKYYMPFAGTYIIGGRQYNKNKNLPIPELQDAVKKINSEIEQDGINSFPIMLNFNENFNLEIRSQSSEYVPIDPSRRDDYINNVARHFKYEFDDDPMPDDIDLMEHLSLALARFNRKKDEINFNDSVNLLFDLPSGAFALIDTCQGTLSKIQNFDNLNNWHRFKLDPRLLLRALKGPRYANWNNIEIGALLDFSRKPDVYRMDVHTLINSLHI